MITIPCIDDLHKPEVNFNGTQPDDAAQTKTVEIFSESSKNLSSVIGNTTGCVRNSIQVLHSIDSKAFNGAYIVQGTALRAVQGLFGLPFAIIALISDYDKFKQSSGKAAIIYGFSSF